MKKLKLILMAFLAVAFFTACDQSETNGESGDGESQVAPDIVKNPATASGDAGEDGDEGMPQIEFRNTTHDFGEFEEGIVVTHAFKFTNTGDGNLIISNTSASCGCTAANYTKEPVAPGEEGFIEVTYDSNGRPGNFSKTVKVTSNTKPNQHTLTIKGNVVNN